MIWLASWQPCCRGARQISERLEKLWIWISRLQNLTVRRWFQSRLNRYQHRRTIIRIEWSMFVFEFYAIITIVTIETTILNFSISILIVLKCSADNDNITPSVTMWNKILYIWLTMYIPCHNFTVGFWNVSTCSHNSGLECFFQSLPVRNTLRRGDHFKTGLWSYN